MKARMTSQVTHAANHLMGEVIEEWNTRTADDKRDYVALSTALNAAAAKALRVTREKKDCA